MRTINFIIPYGAALAGAFIAIKLVGLSAPWYLRLVTVFIMSYLLYDGAKYILGLLWKNKD